MRSRVLAARDGEKDEGKRYYQRRREKSLDRHGSRRTGA